MQNKSVLIITPFFAPQSHAAVFRAYKLAKYLPQLGWKVFVLTVDTNYHFYEDQTLLADLPKEVSVHSSRYIEPTLRGVRMALGGKDRTFLAELSSGGIATPASGPAAIRPEPRLATRMYQGLLERFAQAPDAYWTWKRGAVREALRLIDEHSIPLVMTSSPPYTTLEIGAELKRQRGVRWLADFRDPMTYHHRQRSHHARVYARQWEIEKLAYQEADAIIYAMSGGELIASDLHGPGYSEKLHFIPTGLDEALVPSKPAPVAKSDAPFILFVGEYLEGYGGGIFEIFAQALKDPRVSSRGLKFRLLGRKEINERVAGPHVDRLGLRDSVEFLTHVPQAEVYRQIQRAEAAVLCTATGYGWWILHAKLVDYLALRKPVLARVPDPSEARKWLTASGLGIFLDGDIGEAAARLAESLAEGPARRVRPVENVCSRFLASSQARAFSELFVSQLATQGLAKGLK